MSPFHQQAIIVSALLVLKLPPYKSRHAKVLLYNAAWLLQKRAHKQDI